MSGYRLRALMLALLMTCSALSAWAEAPSAEAWRLAVSYVPASALPLGTWTEDEDVSIFHFEDALRNISYEVRVLDTLLTMQEVQMTALNLKGAAHASLPQEEIEAAIHATYPGARLYGLYRQQAAGLYYYLAIFTQPEQDMFYAMQFDAQTGDLMNYRMKQAAPEEEGLLSLAQAIEIGAAHAGSDALADLTFTRQDGRYVYLLTFWRHKGSLLLQIDAASGDILSEQENPEQIIPPATPEITPPPAPADTPRPGPTARPARPVQPPARRDDDDVMMMMTIAAERQRVAPTMTTMMTMMTMTMTTTTMMMTDLAAS